MSRETSLLRPIFEGFEGGFYDLPQELLAARRAEERIKVALAKVNTALASVVPHVAGSRIVKELVVAGARGEIADGFEKAFVAAQDETRRLSAAQALLADARETAVENVPRVASQLADEILADYLRPTMEAAIEKVKAGASVAASVPWDDRRALARADKDVRDYFDVVAGAADSYVVIRTAQTQLRLLTGRPSADAYHWFAELRNMREIWPQRDSGVPGIRGQAPWPENRLARMVWLVNSKAEPWLGTSDEIDAAYFALIAANPLRGGVVSGERGFAAVQSGSGLDRMRS